MEYEVPHALPLGLVLEWLEFVDLITSGDKVYFAENGETKGDLADHYLRVADPLMRTIGGRPVLLQRFPESTGGPSSPEAGCRSRAASWLQTTVVATPNGTTSEALVAADIDHLLVGRESRLPGLVLRQKGIVAKRRARPGHSSST